MAWVKGVVGLDRVVSVVAALVLWGVGKGWELALADTVLGWVRGRWATAVLVVGVVAEAVAAVVANPLRASLEHEPG